MITHRKFFLTSQVLVKAAPDNFNPNCLTATSPTFLLRYLAKSFLSHFKVEPSEGDINIFRFPQQSGFQDVHKIICQCSDERSARSHQRFPQNLQQGGARFLITIKEFYMLYIHSHYFLLQLFEWTESNSTVLNDSW